eukprot:366412-Chlamydomonas_euryale.AAC.3
MVPPVTSSGDSALAAAARCNLASSPATCVCQSGGDPFGPGMLEGTNMKRAAAIRETGVKSARRVARRWRWTAGGREKRRAAYRLSTNLSHSHLCNRQVLNTLDVWHDQP